jgi:hypothetical protein
MTLFTVYDDKYSNYLEMWQLFIRLAYPGYRVIAIPSIGQQVYSAACERYLINPVSQGDVYITDIDMMILPEVPTIEDFHAEEMKREGLCYSGTPRNNDEPEAFDRMAGGIYVTQEWYHRTAERRNAALIESDTMHQIGKGRYDDEKLLKRIIVESGLPIPPKKPIRKRYHGIHLGTIRNYIMYGIPRLRSEMSSRTTVKQARQWVEVCETQEYKNIKNFIMDSVIWSEFNFMDSLCKSHAKSH